MHTITWYLDPSGPYAAVACHAPTGAACRLHCDRPCLDGPDCGHPQIDRGYCGMTPWLDSELPPSELYEGQAVQLTNPTPVDFVPLTDERYGWTYATTPTPTTRRGHRMRLSRSEPLPPDAKSVAAPTAWANPYRPAHRSIEANAVAVENYETWIRTQPNLLNRLHELQGFDLACWCPPELPCHADVLLRLLDEQDPDRKETDR